MARRTIRVVIIGALVLSAMLGTVIPANAGDASLSGTVTARIGGAPLGDVCVRLNPAAPNCATLTDVNGAYFIDLSGAPNGVLWQVQFSRSGYQTGSDFVVVSGPTTLNFSMVRPPCTAPRTGTPTMSVYLPNITKTLGGPTGFLTPFIVQNTGVANTDLEVSFYAFTDGSCVTRRTVAALKPGTSFADVPNNDVDLPDNAQFSVVVRSFGSNVVSVVNEHAGAGARAEALSYDGFSGGATSVFLPNIVRRFFGFHTPFIMQNLGSTATTATAKFVPFDGSAPVTSTRNIAPGQSQFIEPNIEPGLLDGKQYAVTVTSPQPIAVVVNTHNDDASVAAPAAYSTDGIVAGGPNVYGPYAAKNANNSGRTGTISTIVVQNLSTFSVTPTLTFTPLGGGTAQTFTGPALGAGAAWAFDPRFENGVAGATFCPSTSTTKCLADGEYSFRAAGSGQLAAAVNVISPTSAMGYTGVAVPGSRFFLPNVTRTLGGAAGWTTPIILQSVSATGATIEWRRFSDGSLVTTQNLTMTAGSAIRIDPLTLPALSDDTQYAVTVTGTGGSVAAIVIELALGADNAMIYEGFGTP
ncbi:MAG TPA: hypothetical protein VGK15_04200 [Candidatus Limnocylindria bacterium]|jgi:hypothetical protein